MTVSTSHPVMSTTESAANSKTTAIICCYNNNRWSDLCAAIASLEAQTLALEQIVIVVDHNPALRSRLQDAFPNLAIIENAAERGLSGARNTGIAASSSEFLLFLDDDATAAPDMLARLRDGSRDPQVLGCVGTIAPEWLGLPQGWFPPEFLWVVGCTYQGMSPGRVRNLLGAAMMVRRAVFQSVGGFNAGLGRSHSSLPLGCEETEFCIRANLAHPSSHFVYLPDAICHHKVPAQRVTWRYLVARCYAEGMSKARVAFVAQAAGSLSTEQVYVSKTVPLGALRSISAFARGDAGGLARAAAAFVGLGSAAVGYAIARVLLMARPDQAVALRRLPMSLPIAGDTTN